MDIKNKKFHFIAAGGVGMSALALYLTQRGASVTGSDVAESKYTKVLAKNGVNVNIGHDADLITPGMIVVASSAIKDSNPEIIKAKELGLKIYHRSDILKMISDEFSENKDAFFFGFSGTHGKTTTSGLCAYLLHKAGLNPSYVVGGIIPEICENGHFSGNKYFSAELDESDGTIEKYSSDIAVINNMEEDHLDFYKNGFKDIAYTFNKFLLNKPEQKVIINADDNGNKKFMKMYPEYNFITFGTNDGVYCAKNIKLSGFGSSFHVYYKNTYKNTLKLCIPGIHNVYNALAVYSALNEAGIDMSSVVPHFETFTGMGRRFQKVCSVSGIDVYDDYAHHPSEIKTTLNSLIPVKESGKRIVAVFQPHRYSRLQGLWNEFKTAFDAADKLIITDVFPAGEAPVPGVNSKKFAEEINHSDSLYIPGAVEECAKKIVPLLKKNDILITLGAGSVTKIGSLVNQELSEVSNVC